MICNLYYETWDMMQLGTPGATGTPFNGATGRGNGATGRGGGATGPGDGATGRGDGQLGGAGTIRY